MRIAVDAMGGDFAPTEVIRGAVDVATQSGFEHEIVLVGDAVRIEAALKDYSGLDGKITIRHASEEIAMGEHPVHAIRKKRDSSLVVCGQMVKSGEACGTISAGNTGAAMAIGSLDIGRIAGIQRPALAAELPTLKGHCLLLDAGANVDCTPEILLQFALLGSVYAERVMRVSEPTVGVLSNGSEESKGNELSKATHKLIAQSHLRLFGNVEGKDVFDHVVDVVVCDGFAGNVLLKSGEGVAEMMYALLQTELDGIDPQILAAMRPILGTLLRKIDYAERGGAPLLGIDGVSVIAHGRSRAKAIANAIRTTISAASSDFVSAIKLELPRIIAEGDTQ